jgi:hypothetical protein
MKSYEQKYFLKIEECKRVLFRFNDSFIQASDVINELILDGIDIDKMHHNLIRIKYFNLRKYEPSKVSLSFIENGSKEDKRGKINNVKTCYVCRDMLLEMEFGITTRNSNGKQESQSYCKNCANEYGKKRWKEVNSKNTALKDKNNLLRKILYEKQKKDPEYVAYRRAIAKKHYDIKNNNEEWRKKENERIRLYKLRIKNEKNIL